MRKGLQHPGAVNQLILFQNETTLPKHAFSAPSRAVGIPTPVITMHSLTPAETPPCFSSSVHIVQGYP